MSNLKSFVNNPKEWGAFENYINDSISILHRKLEKQVDMESTAFLRGRIYNYRELLKLRDIVNNQ